MRLPDDVRILRTKQGRRGWSDPDTDEAGSVQQTRDSRRDASMRKERVTASHCWPIKPTGQGKQPSGGSHASEGQLREQPACPSDMLGPFSENRSPSLWHPRAATGDAAFSAAGTGPVLTGCRAGFLRVADGRWRNHGRLCGRCRQHGWAVPASGRDDCRGGIGWWGGFPLSDSSQYPDGTGMRYLFSKDRQGCRYQLCFVFHVLLSLCPFCL